MQRPTFARNIIKRRNELGWNQQRLADEAHLGLNTIKAIERGISGGWPGTKEAIARALNCTVDDLSAPTMYEFANKPAVLREPESAYTADQAKELAKDVAKEVLNDLMPELDRLRAENQRLRDRNDMLDMEVRRLKKAARVLSSKPDTYLDKLEELMKDPARRMLLNYLVTLDPEWIVVRNAEKKKAFLAQLHSCFQLLAEEPE